MVVSTAAGASGALPQQQAHSPAQIAKPPATPAQTAQASQAASEATVYQGRLVDQQGAVQQPPRAEPNYGALKKKKKSSKNAPEEEKEPEPQPEAVAPKRAGAKGYPLSK